MQRETQRNSGKQLCFARRHIPAAIESFHRYALNTSRGSGIFYRSDRRDGKDFGVSKNTITRWVRRLEMDGWMIPLDKDRRLMRNKKTGTYESIPYLVLDHDAWASVRPGICSLMASKHSESKEAIEPAKELDPVHETGTGQYLELVPPVPAFDSASPYSPLPPVPAIGTKTEGLDRNIDRTRDRRNSVPSFDSREATTTGLDELGNEQVDLARNAVVE